MRSKLMLSVLLLSFTLLATGCASSYRNVDPQNLNYLSQNKQDDVTLNYKYNILKNKKYKKKQDKENINLVAIKLENNSDQDYIIGRDLYLAYENGSEIIPLENETIYRALKQDGAYHLLYLLLTPTQFYSTRTENGVIIQDNSFPIGLILGPGLAGYNLLTASTANKKFKKELEEYSVWGKNIKAGETLYGILAIPSSSPEMLKVKFEK